MPIAAGTHLGPVQILAPLGAGGMGEVYRAHDTKLHRDVAIKVLPESLGADPDRRARFEREAHVLASLNHPHIAQIHGFEDSTGVPALVMELVEGPTLADRIARGRVPVGEALAIARQIAEALDAAHEQGIIHRDLKPANIQVRDDGTVKVLDFGLAKAVGPAEAGPHVQAGHGHTADESGRREIHVRPFPAFDRKWTISTDGGAEPIWRRDGKELFYRNRDTVMTVTTDMSAGFKASAPQALFRGDYDQTNATTGHPHFDVASDGQRFLMVKPEKSASQIVVVLNWLDEFKRRAAETR